MNIYNTPLTCETILNQYSEDLMSIVKNDSISKLQACDKDSNKVFATWISQEYLFNHELMKLFASSLSKCPSIHGLKVLSKAINFLREDFDFLVSKMTENKITVKDIGVMKETKEYTDFLKSLHDCEYSNQISLLWLICYLYNQALEENQFESKFSDLMSRWKGFNFVEILEQIKEEVNRNFTSNPKIAIDTFKENLNKIRELEINSWGMLTSNL